MKTFKLDTTPKIEPGFKTPEHYFDNFSEKVMRQIPIEKNEKPKVISLFQKRKTIILMVAAVFVIALMLPVLYTSSINSKELDDTTLENYLSYQSSINQYDLINGLEMEDINNIETTVALEDDAIEDILSANSNLEQLIIE
jgi:hypothetical protein